MSTEVTDEIETPERLREQASRCLRLASGLAPGTSLRVALEEFAACLLDEAQKLGSTQ
jgi:hypothetical protein